MSRIEASRMISAPVAEVFDTVAHIENFSVAVPHITNVELLTESSRGVGARFRETRVLRGRQATTELEVTEYESDRRVRLVADEAGTIWDSLFTVAAEGSGTRLELVMEARPYKLSARILNLLAKSIVRRGLENDLDAVKAYCERQSGARDELAE